MADHLRPLNHVKIYGADTGRYGTGRDAVERFWRGIVGGAASVRFHRPPSGQGLNETAQAHLRSARLFTEAFDLFRATPDAESRRLAGRAPDEAYLSCTPGEQYALYFPEGGAVELDLRDAPGAFRLRWLDLSGSRWLAPVTIRGGDWRSVEAPGPGHWAAVLVRA